MVTKKVLIAGESWFSYTTHVKGFDTFYTTKYEEGVGFIKKAIEKAGYQVDYLPNHLAPDHFPTSLEALSEYDVVILSDIGSNTLLLPDSVFSKGQVMPNRLELIKEYVSNGGGFLMIGGYMAFCGIDAKSRYGQTAIADILPVKCLDIDDRMETPNGATPKVVKDHKVISDLPKDWPHFLGYNKTLPINEGDLVMTINDDPFIAVREYGKGKTCVFTSDCAPHWGSPEFVAWEGYDQLWAGILAYLANV